jgi:hypothetical protein
MDGCMQTQDVGVVDVDGTVWMRVRTYGAARDRAEHQPAQGVFPMLRPGGAQVRFEAGSSSHSV